MENLQTQLDPASFTERFINQTNVGVFLTGKAGTGKTTLLRKIVDSTHKNTVIVAPTGIAALNAGGVTIHSFFGLPFGGFIPEFIPDVVLAGNIKLETKETLRKHFHFNGQKLKIFRKLELLIIDEVSMLRADILDAIDWELRNVRKNNSAFGGVQVLFIGDLLQLPPVVKQEEWSVLRNHYNGMFFFNAHVLHENPPLYIELEKIYRQDDQTFIDLLNSLRNNQLQPEHKELLLQFVQKDFDSTKHEGYITLTTHNSKADQINATALEALSGKKNTYQAEITDDFPPSLFPIEKELVLKEGAQVMFIKNDLSYEKNYYNGKMGRVKSLSTNEITVYFPEEKRSITVEKYEWSNIKYELNATSGEIEEKVLGTFVHYPLKLAWAITVHKSQGLTFEKAVLDVAQVFAPGQAYVALSRLKSLKGLVLLDQLSMNGLTNDSSVVNYAQNKASMEHIEITLDKSTTHYLAQTLYSTFDWYDYTTKWATFELSFKQAGAKTEKYKDKAWVAAQLQAVRGTFDAAKKFQNQLNNLFQTEKPDWNYIHDRIQAAYNYFFNPLDAQVYSIMKRRAELLKIKRTTTYADELQELENEVVEIVRGLMKVRLLVEAIVAGRNFDKQVLKTPEYLNYTIAKAAKINQELRQENPLYDMYDEEKENLLLRTKTKSSKKKSQPKEKKLSTYEITLELLESGKSMQEIARERVMTLGTIVSHAAKLIQQEKIDLEDVMEPDRIQFVESLLTEHEGKSAGTIKDEVGDLVSYDELKLVRASKLI